MAVFKYRLPPFASRSAVGRAYMTGLDRSATRLRVAVEGDVLVCRRDGEESGRLFVPWLIPGFGTAFVGTATLGERAEPYDLAVELARGKLNDVRNQLADWQLMGLRVGSLLTAKLEEAQRAFFRAVTSRSEPAEATVSAQQCLAATWEAGQALVEHYIQQVINTRVAGGVKLPTGLAAAVHTEPKRPWSAELKSRINTLRLACPWRTISPTEGQNRWETLDAQLAWAVKHRMTPHAGPLIDLRADALPDWLCLWDGDFETIQGLAVELVRQAVGRYRGKVPTWTLIHRPGSTDILGLGEEDQVRLAARLLQVARHVDPAAQFLVGVDRPWGEWLGQSKFQLGPLHLADYLARSELGLSGIELEVALGYTAPGSGLRDLFEFSRLLDLYALINLPLYVTLALPSSLAADPKADPSVKPLPGDWPDNLDEQAHARWASGFIALAAAKPFVRSVTWWQPTDGLPHLYPNAGLMRADHTPKPLADWLRTFRKDLVV
jgi:hypothetical protein